MRKVYHVSLENSGTLVRNNFRLDVSAWNRQLTK